MVTLDNRGRAIGAATFNEIGIQSSLNQELGVGDATRVLFENAHEQLANNFAFSFGFGSALEAIKELRTRINMNQFDTHIAFESFDDLIAFTFTHETGVDIHARELCTNRAMYKRGRNC